MFVLIVVSNADGKSLTHFGNTCSTVAPVGTNSLSVTAPTPADFNPLPSDPKPFESTNLIDDHVCFVAPKWSVVVPAMCVPLAIKCLPASGINLIILFNVRY